jgi:GNAT superfamily N-acetyltransferase
VHTDARRRGIARQMMTEMEQIARDAGLKLLMLDTQKGGAAEILYKELGWTTLGVVPRFALLDGYLIDTVYFYKEL